MKAISVVFLISLTLISTQIRAQKKMNLGSHADPLIYLNGTFLKGSLSQINPDTVGVVFMEGDSSWVKRTYGNSTDTSLIRKYFGEQRDRGMVFIYTIDKVQAITVNQFKKCFKNEKCKMVFKIDNKPLTDNYPKVDTAQIQVIKNFALTHWDTGVTDMFTLFVITSKK